MGLGRQGLNDLGQVGFRYTLGNGTEGIAVATLPEQTHLEQGLYAFSYTVTIENTHRLMTEEKKPLAYATPG